MALSRSWKFGHIHPERSETEKIRHVYTMRRGLRRKQKPLILKLDDEWAWHRDACPPLLFQSGPLLLPSYICNSLCGGHRSNESKQNAGVGTGKVKEKWEESVGKGKGHVSIIMHFHYLFLFPFPPLLLLSLVVFIYLFSFLAKVIQSNPIQFESVKL